MLNMRVGHDTDYLTEAVAKGREGYYTGAVVAGEPPGLWYGKGAAALGLAGEVDAEVMKVLYTHGLDPRDPNIGSRETWGQAERFGSAPRNYRKADEIYAQLVEANPEATAEELELLRAQAAKSARQSVAFYDVILSAPKSMTVAWLAFERAANDARAAGDEDAAAEWQRKAGTVEEALLVGHRAVLDFLADKAGYSRAGHHGGGAGQWVDGTGIVAAQFLQHDSRDKDPQLHVHGPVLNRQECADGKVRALDGTLFNLWKPAASAVGARTAEAYLWERLGTDWRTRADGVAREIVGVDAESTGLFSKRTKAITPTLDGLVARFRAETGREPTAREHTRLADRATLATRRGKVFGGETREGQIARWAEEHSAELGVELGDVARTITDRRAGEPALWSERDVLARALAALEERKQSWTRADLEWEISQALPGNLGVAHRDVRELLDGLTDKGLTLAQHLNPLTGPEGLDRRYYRADGTSVFVRPGNERYATVNQLLGEDELRAAAVRRGAPAWTAEEADELVARFARSGRTLGEDQAAALRGILTSGAAVEVLMAPAGTGKSFLVGTLAESWGASPQSAPGSPEVGEERARRVFGLAYGQRQADVLAEEGVTARNIRRWLDGQARLDAGTAGGDDEAFRLLAGDLVVVDEAGAASTPDLVAIHRRCEASGAKLLLVGDPKQLSAVGAGGALADIAERGIRYELAEVRRFRNGWEGPASLRLRDGDESVVAEYTKHGRLVDGGTPEQAEAAAARAWLASTLQGRDALLVVGSNAAAARVSGALRAELVRLGRVEERGVPLGMQGTYAGVGDLIQARRNAWHLDGQLGNTEAPINRTVYRVTGLAPDGGGLTVARVIGREAEGAEQLGEPLHLPARYVNEHVALAYASTVHAAHGRTVQDGFGVLAPGTDAATAYVEATRGTDTNVLFAVTRNVDEGSDTGQTFEVAERAAAAVLADVIRPPDGDRNRTALAEAEAAADRARSMAANIDPMLTVLDDALAGRTGRWLDELAATGDLPQEYRVAFAADEARESLDQLLRSAELAGHDPRQALASAVTATSLTGSTSVAQVLHFRIRSAMAGKLAPAVTSYRDLLPSDLPADTRAGLLALADAADARRAELGSTLAFAAPTWATEALGPVPDDADERAAWEAKAGWAASYRELVEHTDAEDPLGSAPPRGLAEKHALFHTAHAALDLATAGAEEEAMSEGQLRVRIAAWEREKAAAPEYVADRLEATHAALRAARENATLWSARADYAATPLDADQLRAAAEQARGRVAELEKQVEDLQLADDTRAAWRYDTAVIRDYAERARHAAAVRGIDLDNPAERVTADEWLDAHRADQLAEDAHREITELDVDADTDQHDRPARENEREDERRPPPTDATSETVDRATLTLSMIQRRQDDSLAANAADPSDDDRLDELTRWVAKDVQGLEARGGADEDLNRSR